MSDEKGWYVWSFNLEGSTTNKERWVQMAENVSEEEARRVRESIPGYSYMVQYQTKTNDKGHEAIFLSRVDY